MFRHLAIAALVALGCPLAAQEATLRGTFVWKMEDPAFGGFSAIEVADDGRSFYALGDRGWLAQGQLARQDGLITGVTLDGLLRLRDARRIPLSRAYSDSEGLAIAADGTLWISFEWMHGLRSVDPQTGITGQLITDQAFDGMQSNASLEALAAGPDGTLYTLPERSGNATLPFPVFAYRAGAWRTAFTIPRRGTFLAAGADVGPDGRLYLLERDFVGFGFRNRVRRFELDGTGETVILQTLPLVHDNLEGISIWRDGDDLVMTMISDDNFRMFQRTEIVEYQLTQD